MSSWHSWMIVGINQGRVDMIRKIPQRRGDLICFGKGIANQSNWPVKRNTTDRKTVNLTLKNTTQRNCRMDQLSQWFAIIRIIVNWSKIEKTESRERWNLNMEDRKIWRIDQPLDRVLSP
jgi:hypothetical protein